MAWQVFAKWTHRGAPRDPSIFISKRGMGLMNAAAVAAHGADARFVELYFDPETNRIAIRLLSEATPPAMTLASSGKRLRSAFSMRGFLVAHGKTDLFSTRHHLVAEGPLLVLERISDERR